MDSASVHTPGSRAFVNGEEVLIVRQVLFNRPAYRVRSLRPHLRAPEMEWVVDGAYLSTDRHHRVGFGAAQVAGAARYDAA